MILYKKNLIGIFIIVVVFSFSCTTNPEEIFIKSFNANATDFEQMVNYIDQKYIYNDNSGLNRKTFLECKDRKMFRDHDYRICDDKLADLMRSKNVSVISVEKNVCFGDRSFDLIIFELETINGNNFSYHYSFCNSNVNSVESANVKNIPLKKNWSLFVEKN